MRAIKHKKAQNATSNGGLTKPVKVLLYIRTKTSLLGPFKKLNCLDDLIYITTVQDLDLHLLKVATGTDKYWLEIFILD